jgi:hypothetical protein
MVVFFVVAAFLVVSHSAYAADPNGYLYIAHAAAGRNVSTVANPALPWDFSIGGDCVAQGVSYGQIRGPFTLTAGSYPVVVSVANSAKPCSNSSVFSVSVTLTAGIASLGVISFDSANQLSGTITTIPWSAIATTNSRLVVANVTPDNLTAFLYHGDNFNVAGQLAATANFAANSITTVRAPVGEFTISLSPEVSPPGPPLTLAGPLRLDLGGRNIYLLVFAGSAANSVQFVGPAVIQGVY